MMTFPFQIPSFFFFFLLFENHQPFFPGVVIIDSFCTTKEMSKPTVHCWLIYRPKPLQEITRVIIRMWFLQESAMKMNGLHESNSKLNIRSYPEAKKADSDLILPPCPPALGSSLSTSETLWSINHLRFVPQNCQGRKFTRIFCASTSTIFGLFFLFWK